MKHIYLFFVVTMFLLSCQKEVQQNDYGYLDQVKTSLHDSLSQQDFENLDFSRAVLSKADSPQLYFLRIPFNGKKLQSDFVLLQTSKVGKVQTGKIIHLEGGQKMQDQNITWNGSVIISSLSRKDVLQSAVTGGYIEAFHKSNSNARLTSMMAPDVLPEIVVVAYTGGGVSYADWVWLQSFFYQSMDYGSGSGGGDYGSYYGSLDGSYGGGGGTYSGSTEPTYGVQTESMLEFEPEYVYSLTGIDLTKIFKCFDNVPSVGAVYSVKLCTDIPSNNNPGASSNSTGVSAGHTFLIVSKKNGTTAVTQSFGFYPQSSPSWYDPFASVTSTMKDNGSQEINASLEMTISESQFNTVKQNAINWSKRNYALGDYNCTNYAMDIFNSVRTTPISVAPYKVILPGNTNPWAPSDPITITIEKSPQKLFTKLQEMKTTSAESSLITIQQDHNYRSPISKGECD